VYDEGYGPQRERTVTHERRIFFVKPEYWIITDQLKTLDGRRHRYDSLFHLNAPSASVDETTKMVLTQDSEGSNLAIIPPRGDDLRVEIVSGQEEPVVQGWIPTEGYEVKPIPTAILTKEGIGLTQFIYILYPIPKGGKCPIKSVERIEVQGKPKGAQGIKITFDNGVVHYFIQAESKGQFNFAEYSTRGEVTFLEVKPNGQVGRRMVLGEM
jgi:hypothetical protein